MQLHILAFLAVTALAGQEPTAPIAFVGVQVVPMDEERVLADQTVVAGRAASSPLVAAQNYRCRRARPLSMAAAATWSRALPTCTPTCRAT